MPEISIRVEGLDEVRAAFDALPENIGPTVTRALTMVASELVEQIQSEISESYPPPSLPYTPPHTRTGALRSSVRIERIEPGRVTVAIGGPGSMVPYAAWLEFGTSKMEERPFIMPMVERITEASITNTIVEEINKDLEAAIR